MFSEVISFLTVNRQEVNRLLVAPWLSVFVLIWRSLLECTQLSFTLTVVFLLYPISRVFYAKIRIWRILTYLSTIFFSAVCSGVDPRCWGGVEVCWAHQGLQKWRCLPAAPAGGWKGEDVWKSCACRNTSPSVTLSLCSSLPLPPLSLLFMLSLFSFSRTTYSILLLYTPPFSQSLSPSFFHSLLSHLSLFPSLSSCLTLRLFHSLSLFLSLFLWLSYSLCYSLSFLQSLSPRPLLSHSLITPPITFLLTLSFSLWFFSPTLVFFVLLSHWFTHSGLSLGVHHPVVKRTLEYGIRKRVMDLPQYKQKKSFTKKVFTLAWGGFDYCKKE